MASKKDPNEAADPRERVQRPSAEEDYPAYSDEVMEDPPEPGKAEQGGAAKDDGAKKDDGRAAPSSAKADTSKQDGGKSGA